MCRSQQKQLLPAPMLLILLVALAGCNAFAAALEQTNPAPTCSAQAGDEINPHLQRHTFDLGYGEEEFDFYVQPDVSTYYREEPGSRKAVTPKHVGLAAKWVNMSPEDLLLFWDPADGRDGSLIGACGAFQSAGTASFPTHKFYFARKNDPHNNILARFEVKKNQSVYYYDPFEVPGNDEATRKNLQSLSLEEYEMYEMQKRTRLFNDKYKEITGRDYLAIYPRDKPRQFHWPADYFGQEHWAITKETHFKELPPQDKLGKITAKGKDRVLGENDPRILQEYRTEEPVMNMTLKVLSCAPRAYEIPNFLSDVEVDHILDLAGGMQLHKSTTGAGSVKADSRTKTRTSLNTWVSRETSPVIDAVYRRAADLLRFDEALVRRRDADEEAAALVPESLNSIAEPLQLVHYAVGQEYTAHHDFGYSNSDDKLQPQRFATLLLYLNEPGGGGETAFPRWINAETSAPLKAKPERGKAVLFYSFLPDGNMDDLSHHAAVPVTEGEKWLINMWVRDPIHSPSSRGV